MQIFRSTDYRRMPWKNGGGETREVVASPAGATLDSLDWRVSLATVAMDGPFSVFKGVQRTLCVIRGAGIQLQAGDRAPVELYTTSDPHTFDGEAATSARLIDGTIEDLNVMSRRGRFRHDVRRLAIDDTLLLEINAHTLIIYCQRGELRCIAVNESEDLRSDDCAMFDQPGRVQLVADGTAEIIFIELFAE